MEKLNTSKMRDELNSQLEAIEKHRSKLDLNVSGQDDEIYFLERVSSRITDLLDDLDYYDECKRKDRVLQRQ